MRWKIWPSSKESRIDLEKRGISLLERTFKSIPAVLIGVVLTFALSRSGFFRQLETYALDTQVRLQGSAEDSDLIIVRIDDADYASLFHEKSPLDQASLQKLISAIAAGKPRVIAVDIDTSAPEFRDLHPAPEWPKVVWARNGIYSNIDGKYHLTQLLGQQEPPVLSGLVILQLDPDGAIRRYPRLCETDHGLIDSFPWVVAKEFDPVEAARRKPDTSGLFIKFAGDNEGSHRLHFTASRIMELADGPGWQSESPIKDKIVILGGAYGATDEHDTPLGWMLGSEALAYAIETELQGGGLSPPSPILITALGGIVGVALLLMFQHFTPPKAFLISLFAIPVLGMLGSLLTFKTMAFWAYFVPIPLAVLGQEVYAKVKDYRMKLIKNLYDGVVKKPVVAEPPEIKSNEESVTIKE
jgi:CHASE2 domain-containing sensor protein